MQLFIQNVAFVVFFQIQVFKEKSYDGVSLERIRNRMDDFYLLNPDIPQKTGEEGKLLDLSGLSVLSDAKHLDDTLDALEVMLSDKALQTHAETNKVISPSKNAEVEYISTLKMLNDLVNDGTYVLASNAGMKVEQWDNTCLIVRDLLNGTSVEECMTKFDKLQEKALSSSGK